MGSVLSPLEMMMPSGSDDSVSLRSFFIDSLTLSFAALIYAGLEGSARASSDACRILLLIKGLRIEGGGSVVEASHNDTS